jgi:hypothetical protein
MANELVAQVNPADLFRLGGGPTKYNDRVISGVVGGVRLKKSDANGYSCIVRVPPGLTMGTGLTFTFGLTDDGKDANDLGKVVRLGVTAKRLVGGTDVMDLTVAGTEQTVDVTLNATSGVLVIGSLAIAAANLDSAVVGDRILFRVRRVGTHANDTCTNAVVLTDINVINT